MNLKNVVAPTHQLPSEVLPGAKTIIAYFVPFAKELAYSNHHGGEIASPEWALAYEETNAVFRILNEYLTGALMDKGFDRKKCYLVLRKNAERYTEFGSSYDAGTGKDYVSGSEVCGKCVTNVPCAFLEYLK